jgi:hypothetical protein
MYLKVYRRGQHCADPETVRAVLKEKQLPGSVDTDLGYPCVEFPEGTSWEMREIVRQTLFDAGFETE